MGSSPTPFSSSGVSSFLQVEQRLATTSPLLRVLSHFRAIRDGIVSLLPALYDGSSGSVWCISMPRILPTLIPRPSEAK